LWPDILAIIESGSQAFEGKFSIAQVEIF
jgi:hypothetical protein